jgi:hypothetical protein
VTLNFILCPNYRLHLTSGLFSILVLLFPFAFALSERHHSRYNFCWNVPQTLFRFGVVHKLSAQLRLDQDPWLITWEGMFGMWSVGRIAPIGMSNVISPTEIVVIFSMGLVKTLMRLGSWRVCALSLQWRIHRKIVEGSI